jgi:hypothetical protein
MPVGFGRAGKHARVWQHGNSRNRSPHVFFLHVREYAGLPFMVAVTQECVNVVETAINARQLGP